MPMASSYIYSAHTPKEAEHKQQQHILHISSSPIVPSALPPPSTTTAPQLSLQRCHRHQQRRPRQEQGATRGGSRSSG
ncbi:unnamed protein product [Urochloa humidicola]